MSSYLIKIDARSEGPFEENRIAQMFADGRVNRDTPCRPSGSSSDWKTIDDYLPMLKYGTQLPQPVSVAPPRSAVDLMPADPATQKIAATSRVAVVDIDLPFLSILRLMIKWLIAALIVGVVAVPLFFLFWTLVVLIVARLFALDFPRP